MPNIVIRFVLSRACASFGAALTTFALDVWVYQHTGSYTLFALFAVLAALPGLLLAPVAGILVDRVHRKVILACADSVCILTGVVTALCAASGVLSLVQVALTVVLLGMARTISWPAAVASLPLLANDKALARANGLIEALEGGISIGSPLLGALGMSTVGIVGVSIGNALLTVLALILLWSVLIPQLSNEKVGEAKKTHWREDMFFGFRWIAAHPALLHLLLFFVVINISSSAYIVGYSAYLLSFSGAGLLGSMLAVGGVGAVLGGLCFATCGGMLRHEHAVMACAMLMAVGMILAGLSRQELLLFAMAFIDGFTLAVMNASSQTIWQGNVPLAIQGRVFAVRRMIAWGLNPLSILISIPFIKQVFTPLVAQTVLGEWWGQGTTGALGLMLSSCGLLCLLIAIPLWLTDSLRVNAVSRAHLS